MSKILDATCVGGVVSVGGIVIADAVVQSQGVGSSSGVLLIEDDKSTYIASSASDLASVIQSVCTILSAHDALLGSTQTAAIATLLLKASALK